MPTYYRNRETGKIEAKYIGCDTQSVIFRNTELYERFKLKENLPLEIQLEPSPPEKNSLELRVETLEKELGIAEKESWIDKIRNFLHL